MKFRLLFPVLLLSLCSFVWTYGYKTFEESFYTVGDRMIIKGVYFGTHYYHAPSPEAALKVVYDFMQRHPAYVIEIGVYTDDRGSDAYNLRLTQKRALVLRRVMIDHYKIDSTRIIDKGYGEADPLISSDSIARMKTDQERYAAYEMNRRAEVKILKTE